MLLALSACTSGPAVTVTGLVVDVQGDLTSVSEFTVLTGEGERLTLVPSEDGDYDFPLPHLRDHLRNGEPVEVRYERRDGRLVALDLSDA